MLNVLLNVSTLLHFPKKKPFQIQFDFLVHQRQSCSWEWCRPWSQSRGADCHL